MTHLKKLALSASASAVALRYAASKGASRVDRGDWSVVATDFEKVFAKAVGDVDKWAKRVWPQNAGVSLKSTKDSDHDNGDPQRYGYSANTTAKVELWVGREEKTFEITLTEDTQPPELDEGGEMEVDLDKNVIEMEWDTPLTAGPWARKHKGREGESRVVKSLTTSIEDGLRMLMEDMGQSD
jgi:hypothetical protein